MSDRTVSTDALATLGTNLGPDEKRDAIHLAVMPVIAARPLRRAADIGIRADGVTADDRDVPFIGIVDPFNSFEIVEGTRFWLVIYPRVITSLRHVWSHPCIPDELSPQVGIFSREISQTFLEGVAAKLGIELDDFREEIFDGSFFRTDIDAGPGIREVPPGFYEHYENYFGFKIPQCARTDWFSCGC